MGTIKKFEELKVWQKARELNLEIYQISNKKEFAKDVVLQNQIRRASISILSNIAEGFERDGTKEFIYFLSIAKSSSAEVRAQLYVAKDLNYIHDNVFLMLKDKVEEVGKMINGLRSYLKSTEFKGLKFREDTLCYGANNVELETWNSKLET